MLNEIKVFVATLVLCGAGCLWYTHVEVNKAVSATKVEMDRVYKKKFDAQVVKAQEVEDDLRARTLQYEQVQNEKLKSISTQLAAANRKLRDRPSRESATVNSTNPGDSQACTGAKLFREDGEFLTGEAARADAILSQRDYYYYQYELIRKELNEFAK